MLAKGGCTCSSSSPRRSLINQRCPSDEPAKALCHCIIEEKKERKERGVSFSLKSPRSANQLSIGTKQGRAHLAAPARGPSPPGPAVTGTRGEWAGGPAGAVPGDWGILSPAATGLWQGQEFSPQRRPRAAHPTQEVRMPGLRDPGQQIPTGCPGLPGNCAPTDRAVAVPRDT